MNHNQVPSVNMMYKNVGIFLRIKETWKILHLEIQLSTK